MRNLIILTGLVFATTLTFSCGNAGQTTENKDTTVIDEQKTPDDGSLTVTAKFVNAGSLEGDADFTFEKADGSKIIFYRNYMDSKEPKLNFEFIGDDGASPNPKLVGQTFVIKYKVNPKGRISMVSGEGEPCNQILSAEKK
jgi:hypothetical protein